MLTVWHGIKVVSVTSCESQFTSVRHGWQLTHLCTVIAIRAMWTHSYRLWTKFNEIVDTGIVDYIQVVQRLNTSVHSLSKCLQIWQTTVRFAHLPFMSMWIVPMMTCKYSPGTFAVVISASSINRPSSSSALNASCNHTYSHRFESHVLRYAGKLGGRRRAAKKRHIFRIEPQKRSSKSSSDISDSAHVPVRASCGVL